MNISGVVMVTLPQNLKKSLCINLRQVKKKEKKRRNFFKLTPPLPKENNKISITMLLMNILIRGVSIGGN